MTGQRGRPPTFTAEERQYFAELIRSHGLRRARALSRISVSLGTLSKIALEAGIELGTGRRKGTVEVEAKPVLSVEQRRIVAELIARGPRHYGYRTNAWTYRRATDVIGRTLGVACSPGQVKEILDAAGYEVIEQTVIKIQAIRKRESPPDAGPAGAASTVH